MLIFLVPDVRAIKNGTTVACDAVRRYIVTIGLAGTVAYHAAR
jgi:hypothetical protein